jgi:hypothetical protein
MARLPEVCVRVGQISCFGLIEAKPFELIDPPEEALVVRTRLKSLATLCFAVLHISPRRVDIRFRRLSPRLPPAELVRVVVCAELGCPAVAIATGIAAASSRNVAITRTIRPSASPRRTLLLSGPQSRYCSGRGARSHPRGLASVLLDIGDVRPVDRHSRAIVPYQAVEQTGIVLA